MFQAKNQAGEMVNSLKLKDPSQDFYCLECGERLVLRKSAKKRPHFAHQKEQVVHGESWEHQNGKNFFLSWGENQALQPRVEERLLKGSRRGDLFLDEQKKVLEIQCSPMSDIEIKKRTQDYLQQGFDLQWILGRRYLIKKNFTSSQKKFMQYDPALGFYFFILQDELFLYQHCLSINNVAHFKRQKIKTSENFLSLWQVQNWGQLEKIIWPQSPQLVKKKIARGLYYRQPALLKEQAFFYQRQRNLLSLPEIFYQMAQVTLPFMTWPACSLLFHLLEQVEKRFYPWEQLENIWQPILNQQQEMPLVAPKYYFQSYVKTYFPDLQKAGILNYGKMGVKFLKSGGELV